MPSVAPPALCGTMNRKVEPVRIVERETASARRFVLRLLCERIPARFDPLRERVNVLHRRAPDTHPDAALAIAPFRPIVLRESQVTNTCLEHDALKRAVAPCVPLADDEP